MYIGVYNLVSSMKQRLSGVRLCLWLKGERLCRWDQLQSKCRGRSYTAADALPATNKEVFKRSEQHTCVYRYGESRCHSRTSSIHS